MRYVKLILTFLVFVIIVLLALSFFLPTHQKVEKSISISAPVSTVYGLVSRLENFNKWSVWTREDSTAEYKITGNDGNVGAVSEWNGHPEISGSGTMKISALEPNKKVMHEIEFRGANEATANSEFLLSGNEKLTNVTWKFIMPTPRPWNIFNLFYSMEKQMGQDFSDGLAELKKRAEGDTH